MFVSAAVIEPCVSFQRRKFVVESRAGKKKYIYITERSRTAKYLCNLCSAQHKFNNEMSSRQLSHSMVFGQLQPPSPLLPNSLWGQHSEALLHPHHPFVFHAEESILQYASVSRAQSGHLKPFSCSDAPQDDSGLTTPQNETLTKLCDDVAARIEARIKQQRQCLNEQRYEPTASFVCFRIVVHPT